MADDQPIRVLVVHRGLTRDRDEAREVIELAAGMTVRARERRDLDVRLSDRRRVYRLDVDASRPRLVDVGPHRAAIRTSDVVHVHMLLHWTQVLTALHARVRGARVVFSPMSMLGKDYATASWFRDASPWFRTTKPLLVALLRLIWLRLAHVVVATSEEEIRQARLPRARTVLVPLAAPDSPLADAPPLEQKELGADAPVAFLTRFDVHRKGIDRMWTWVGAMAGRLPRPAVLLLAPSDQPPPPRIAELIDQGLVEWDSTSRGVDVLPRLADCRGVMLLSRWDGQTRVLREAALVGLPSISTPNSNFAEVVGTLGVGAIVDGDNPDDIQQAFERVLQQPWSTAATARALFDRDRIGDYLCDLMCAVAAGSLPVPPSYYDVAEPG